MTYDPSGTLLRHSLVGDGCWEWTASKRRGYGRMKARNGRLMDAHRVSYETFVGPIPEGIMVLHSCDNRACVKPSHLFLGTNADNMRDMVEKGRSVHRLGERNPSAKLTNEQVLRIKEALRSGESQSSLARQYGVSQSAVYLIASGKKWGWLQ